MLLHRPRPMKPSELQRTQLLRLRLLQLTLLAAAFSLIWRIISLNTAEGEFLKEQGNARFLRDMEMVANRGTITDRNGEVLAVSAPVESIWLNPQQLKVRDQPLYPRLAQLLGMESRELNQILNDRKDRSFVYLKRHVAPDLAEQITHLGIEGLYTQREYHRYYPMGEVAAHVVGFTNIDDEGQEGIELMFNDELRGKSGLKRVIRDRLGRVVENVEALSDPEPGKSIRLSLDRRIQYLAYRELKSAVTLHGAKGGMAVVLDSYSGEILAMVNQPAYNPNNRIGIDVDALRNRALTDTFEPGSTMKPFTIAAALESGKFSANTPIETSPGYMRLASFTIRDARDYGTIDLTTIIKKSSNVGAGKIALALDREQMWQVLDRFGFGLVSGTGFPGERTGNLQPFQLWQSVRQATIGYGYGISVTALQLTRAYGALAADGRLSQLSLLANTKPVSRRVVKREVARQVVAMIEQVTERGGTAMSARVDGYRIGGKTGTVRKLDAGGYNEEQYLGLFAGIAPVSNPRLVMVTIIDQPESGDYYGGVVAAPVFAKVMTGALRLLNIPPDGVEPNSEMQLVHLMNRGGRKP